MSRRGRGSLPVAFYCHCTVTVHLRGQLRVQENGFKPKMTQPEHAFGNSWLRRERGNGHSPCRGALGLGPHPALHGMSPLTASLSTLAGKHSPGPQSLPPGGPTLPSLVGTVTFRSAWQLGTCGRELCLPPCPVPGWSVVPRATCSLISRYAA